MPSPLRGKYIGFLDDLYVDPKHRRNGIGEKIIKELNEISRRNNWNLVRWITRDDNTKAKSLYEKLSKKTNWEVYELS
jgi:ribosomal protein S18 acetylase RimI-like enzyme